MKRFKLNNLSAFIFIYFLSFFLSSCGKEALLSGKPDQLFRPALFKAEVNVTQVTFTWVPIAGATYSLEISKDSLLFENDLQVFHLESTSSFTVSNLWSNTRYSARIKAVSIDPSIKDSEYKQITFVTGKENIFYPIDAGNIGSNHVLLKWEGTKEVTHIIVSTANSDDVVIPLSEIDITKGEKLVNNLKSGTTYIFKIYLEEMLRGSVTVTTSAN